MVCGLCVWPAERDHLGNVLLCLGGTTFWGDEKCIEVFGRKTEEKRSLERHRRTCEDDIKVDRKHDEKVWRGLVWFRIGRRDWVLVKTALNVPFP